MGQVQAELEPSGEVRIIQDADTEADPFAAPVPVQQGQPLQEGDVRVTDAGTVEIHVNDASLVEVLRMLSLQSQKNIVASKDVRGTVTANLYDVTIREALDAILTSNGFVYREEGNFIFVYSQREMAEMERANRRMQTEVFRLHYTTAANALELVRPVLSSEARTALTGPGIMGVDIGGDTGGNSHAVHEVIVITDYPEQLEQARQVLQQVDAQPQQILVEATILRATLTEDNALGVDFTLMGGVRFNQLDGAPAVTRHQAMTGNLPADQTNYTAGGTDFPMPAQGLKVGVIYNNVAAFISALEQVNDTAILANPKVLTLNRQKGQILVGDKSGYPVATTTDTATIQDIRFLETGTQLVFRPFIGDNDLIRMEIFSKDSAGFVDARSLPFESTTEVLTNIMVRDGHTIVIGGLFREVTNSGRSQVPVLGNIPVVGALFRSQTDRTTREEVIILLTPHIIKDDAAYARESEQQWQNADRLRVGMRHGLLWFGRERLAESHYEKALAQVNQPQPNHRQALWHLRSAINLNPKFLEAIELRESLTGREVTSVDNSSVRHFVREQIIRERGPAPAPADEELMLLPLPWEHAGQNGEALGELDLDPVLVDADGLPLEQEPMPLAGEAEDGQRAEAEAKDHQIADAESAEALTEAVSEQIEQAEDADAVTVIEMLIDDDHEQVEHQVILPLD